MRRREQIAGVVLVVGMTACAAGNGASTLPAGGIRAAGEAGPRAAPNAAAASAGNACPSDGVLYTSFDTSEQRLMPALYAYALTSFGPSHPCAAITTVEETIIEGFAYETHGLAVSAQGDIHAVNFLPIAGVQVYHSTANGYTAPARVIAMPGIHNVFNLAVDAAGNDYVSGQNGLFTRSDASCYAWTGANATLFGSTGEVCSDGLAATAPIYAMAAQADRLVLVTNGQLNILSNPASARPTIAHVVHGSQTLLTENNSGLYGTWYAAATDPVDGTIYVATTDLLTTKILSFSKDADGNVAPQRVLDVPYVVTGPSLAVDRRHNLYVSVGPALGHTAIEVFGAGATGNATPQRWIIDTNGDSWAIAVVGPVGQP